MVPYILENKKNRNKKYSRKINYSQRRVPTRLVCDQIVIGHKTVPICQLDPGRHGLVQQQNTFLPRRAAVLYSWSAKHYLHVVPSPASHVDLLKASRAVNVAAVHAVEHRYRQRAFGAQRELNDGPHVRIFARSGSMNILITLFAEQILTVRTMDHRLRFRAFNTACVCDGCSFYPAYLFLQHSHVPPFPLDRR